MTISKASAILFTLCLTACSENTSDIYPGGHNLPDIDFLESLIEDEGRFSEGYYQKGDKLYFLVDVKADSSGPMMSVKAEAESTLTIGQGLLAYAEKKCEGISKFQTTMTGTIKLLSKNFEGFYRELWSTSIYPIDEKIESICKS